MGRLVADAKDESTFLHALASRIGTRLVVFVPNARSPLSFWVSGPGDQDEIDRLESVGRTWLADPGRGATIGQDAQVHADGTTIAVAAAHSPRSGVIGALVAAKETSGTWTSAEVALVRFAADFYGPDLERCAQWPQSGAGLHPPSNTDRRADFARGIRAAPGNGEMYLLYQPEVDLRTSEVVAVEALVRWQHPVLGRLEPDAFISFAEESGLIKILGAWVVGESFRAFAQWSAATPGLEITLRVNVSPIQLADHSLVPLIAAALAEHRLRGEQICVEITETVPVLDPDGVSAALHTLKKLGVRSALDDFGSGFSSLGRLRALPVDAVKIDRSLIAGLDRDVRAESLVGAVIRLAEDLGIEVIAEGVERPEEAAALVRLGCMRAQGHLFGRPVDAKHVQRLLAGRARKSIG